MQEEMQNYERDRSRLIGYRRIALVLVVIGAIVLAVGTVRGEGLLSPLASVYTCRVHSGSRDSR